MSLQNTPSKHYFEKKSLLSEDFLFVVPGKIEESVSNSSCELSRGLSSILSVDGGDNLLVYEEGFSSLRPSKQCLHNISQICPQRSVQIKVDLIIWGEIEELLSLSELLESLQSCAE